MLADYQYNEQTNNKEPLSGWKLCRITEFTEPRLNRKGTATGSFIRFAVEDGIQTVHKDIYVSMDHPNDFVRARTLQTGAMLKQMFPAITTDDGYVGCRFWCLFRTYTDKNTGELRDSFFDRKQNISLDGLTTLDGNAIPEGILNVSQQPRPAETGITNTGTTEDGSDDVPF